MNIPMLKVKKVTWPSTSAPRFGRGDEVSVSYMGTGATTFPLG